MINGRTSNYVSKNSLMLFQELAISSSFLSCDPTKTLWQLLQSYQDVHRRIRDVK
jgi:hypothetical protein